MKDLVGISSSFPAQRSLETGDDLDEASLEEVAQSSANRAQYLKALTDDMLATGIKKIRVVASPASLKALTGMNTGDVAIISPASPLMGLYVFHGGTLTGDQESWRYQADNSTGSWKRDIDSLVTFGNLDGVAKFNDGVVIVPNRVKDILRYSSSEVTLGDNAAWQDILSSGSMTLYAGDKVIMTFASSAKTTDNAYAASVRLAVTNPTPTTADAGTSAITYDFHANNKRIHVGTQAVFTAATTGSHTLKAQGLVPDGGGPYDVIFGNPSMQVQIIRP